MKKLIVLNLESQNGLAQKKWDSIKSRFQDALLYRIKSGSDSSELRSWLRENIKAPMHPVIAAGGDGTVHSVIQCLEEIQMDASLGMIGLGSSNDYHKPHLREGMEWLGKIPTRIQFEKAVPMDLLKLTIGFQGKKTNQWSALNASVGMTANGNAIFNDSSSFASGLKKMSVDLAITGAALQAYFQTKPLKLGISVDGGPFQENEYVTLGIFKRAHFAGSLHFDRAPTVDDGQLGFATTLKCSKLHQLSILSGLSAGKFAEKKSCSLGFHQTISIQSQMPFILEIDGETQSVDTVEVKVLSRAMRMCP